MIVGGHFPHPYSHNDLVPRSRPSVMGGICRPAPQAPGRRAARSSPRRMPRIRHQGPQSPARASLQTHTNPSRPSRPSRPTQALTSLQTVAASQAPHALPGHLTSQALTPFQTIVASQARHMRFVGRRGRNAAAYVADVAIVTEVWDLAELKGPDPAPKFPPGPKLPRSSTALPHRRPCSNSGPAPTAALSAERPAAISGPAAGKAWPCGRKGPALPSQLPCHPNCLRYQRA